MHQPVSPLTKRWFSQNVRTKQGHPSRQAWEAHKERILSLYLSEDKAMRLEDIIEVMAANHGFSATPAMYKSRLRKWNAYRNRKRASTRIRESAGHLRSDAIASRSCSADELDSVHPSPRERCVKSSTTASDDSDDSLASMSKRRNGSFSDNQYRHSEARTWQPSSKRVVTSVHPEILLDRPSSVASDDTSIESSEHAGRLTPCGSDDSDMTLDSGSTEKVHLDVRTATWSEFLPLSEPQPLVVAGPTSLGHIQHRPKHSQHWLLNESSPPVSRARLDSLIPHEHCPSILNVPEIRVDPKTFVNLSIQYCNLRSEGHHDEADAAASEAGRVYTHVLSQQHSHALISLNTVLIMLLLYGRSTEAFELMSQAREAAINQFQENTHPMVVIIEYFMFQAANNFETMRASQLNHGYNFFCQTLGQDHPYALVAGYLLAWRNAANKTNAIGMLRAIQLLCKLQLISDAKLGQCHLLSIAILKTKARVQHAMKMLPDAIVNMQDVLRRMQATHDVNHPYLLDARSSYAAMLFAVYRDDEAEREYSASALGRAKLFGVEAQATKKSLRDIETFFATTQRTASASDFYSKLKAAISSHLSSSSAMVIPKAAT